MCWVFCEIVFRVFFCIAGLTLLRGIRYFLQVTIVAGHRHLLRLAVVNEVGVAETDGRRVRERQVAIATGASVAKGSAVDPFSSTSQDKTTGAHLAMARDRTMRARAPATTDIPHEDRTTMVVAAADTGARVAPVATNEPTVAIIVAEGTGTAITTVEVAATATTAARIVSAIRIAETVTSVEAETTTIKEMILIGTAANLLLRHRA